MKEYYIAIDYEDTCGGIGLYIYKFILSNELYKSLDIIDYVEKREKENIESYCCSQCYPDIGIITEKEAIKIGFDDTIIIHDNLEEEIL